MFVAAVFFLAETAPAQNIVLDSFNPGAEGGVSALALQPDGRILVGGSFTNLTGQPRLRLGRLYPDGTLDTYFNPGTDYTVTAMALQPDGKILAGGSFTNIDGVIRKYLARLNPDGTIDSAFAPAFSGGILALAIQADGKIVCAGRFTSVGVRMCNYLARLHPDGSLDEGFHPIPSTLVPTLALQADGKILIAGWFTKVSGQSRSYLARLNADGTLDESFNPAINQPPSCIGMQADGKILLGGIFTSVAGQPRTNLARLNPDGTLDASFDPAPDGAVLSIALQADGSILVGGSFTTICGGQVRKSVARLSADGTLDDGLNVDAIGSVSHLAIQPNGRILAAGSFNYIDSQLRRKLACFRNAIPPVQTLARAGSVLTWQRSGSCPEVSRVEFYACTNGVDWSFLAPGQRVPEGWQVEGLSGWDRATIRAQGSLSPGNPGAPAGVVESFLGPPVATVHPVDTLANFDASPRLFVSVGGSEPLYLQWLKDGVVLHDERNLFGTATAMLSLSNVYGFDSGKYALVAGNNFGSVTTRVATLTVADPMIVQHPTRVTVSAGQKVTLESAARGTGPITYQWVRNGASLPGQTNSVCTIASPNPTDSGYYAVMASNQFDVAVSSHALLTVTPELTLADVLDGPDLTWTTGGDAPWRSSTDYNVQPYGMAQSGAITNGPTSWIETVATGPASLTFWWRVQSQANVDFLRFYIDGVEQEPAISGRVGWQLRQFELDAAPHTLRWVYTKISNGTVTGEMAGLDEVWVRRYSVGSPSISHPPESTTNWIGGSACFYVGADGLRPLQYQWLKDGVALPGETNSKLSLIQIGSENAGSYSAIVSNSLGAVTSSVAALVLEQGLIVQGMSSVVNWPGGTQPQGFARDVILRNGLAYVPNSFDGLAILDVRTPANPIWVGNYKTGNVYRARLVGDLAFLATGSSGMEILSITNPIRPTPVGAFSTGWNVRNLQVAGNLVYLAAQNGGMVIVDTSNPSYPIPVGKSDTPGNVWNIQVIGKTAYVADRDTGVLIYDVSRPEKPARIGRFGNNADDLAVAGGRAYVVGGSEFTIFDVSNPESPVRLNTPVAGQFNGVQLVGNLAFLAGNTNGLQVFDVTDPSKPVLMAGGQPGNRALSVYWEQDLAYLAGASNGMQILRVPVFQKASFQQALDAPNSNWTTSENAPWSVQYPGILSSNVVLRSGPIPGSQNSWISAPFSGPGTLSWLWKISSEPEFDHIQVFLDGSAQGAPISGEVDWHRRTLEIGTGLHTVEWRYTKNASVLAGQDCAWLDQVTFTPSTLSSLEIALTNNTPIIRMTGPEGTQWELQAAPAVGATNPWAPLTNLSISNGSQWFRDAAPSGTTRRFYRLKQVP